MHTGQQFLCAFVVLSSLLGSASSLAGGDGEDGVVGNDPEIEAYIYCLENSEGMGNDVFAKAASDILARIDRLDEHDLFSIVVYDSEVSAFPPEENPTEPTLETRDAARSFLDGFNRGTSACAREALIKSVHMLERARHDSARRVVVEWYLNGDTSCSSEGDYSTYISETAAAVKDANWFRSPINTIRFGETNGLGNVFGKTIPQQNGGTFATIPSD